MAGFDVGTRVPIAPYMNWQDGADSHPPYMTFGIVVKLDSSFWTDEVLESVLYY